jgi:hypothetical protein
MPHEDIASLSTDKQQLQPVIFTPLSLRKNYRYATTRWLQLLTNPKKEPRKKDNSKI